MTTNFILAFLGGFISFLSPCVLPLIPGYLCYISGNTLKDIKNNQKSVLFKSVFFSLGFSIIFISFGITASFIGNFLINYSSHLRLVSGAIIILFSLQLIGLINLKILNTEIRFFTKKYNNNFIFPLIVGSAFGFGWTPCIGPILGSILALASLEEKLNDAILLLFFYSLGLAIPFIASAYAINKFLILSKKIKKYISYLVKGGGIILLITGILIITNQLQIIGYFLLEIFPFFSKFG